MPPRFDVCVLGAGPAGSAFAILMARKGARVALVEKSDFQAFRPGEHLPPTARGALRALGCEPDLFEPACIESPGILSRWMSRRPLFKSYLDHPDGFGLNLARATFDRALCAQAERAGAVLFAPASLADAAKAAVGWDLVLRTEEGPQPLSA